MRQTSDWSDVPPALFFFKKKTCHLLFFKKKSQPQVRLAVFSQHHVDGLDLALSPLQYMLKVFPQVQYSCATDGCAVRRRIRCSQLRKGQTSNASSV